MGVRIRINNDTMRITEHGWRYNTRTIWAHLERFDTMQFNTTNHCSNFFVLPKVEEKKMAIFMQW